MKTDGFCSQGPGIKPTTLASLAKGSTEQASCSLDIATEGVATMSNGDVNKQARLLDVSLQT